MALIRMTKCDNPKCKNTDHPTSEPGKEYVGPYRWFQLEVYCAGEYSVNVDACCFKCVGPAVEFVYGEKVRQDQNE